MTAEIRTNTTRRFRLLVSGRARRPDRQGTDIRIDQVDSARSRKAVNLLDLLSIAKMIPRKGVLHQIAVSHGSRQDGGFFRMTISRFSSFSGIAPPPGFGKSVDVSFTGVQEIQKINSPVFACFANTQENEVFP